MPTFTMSEIKSGLDWNQSSMKPAIGIIVGRIQGLCVNWCYTTSSMERYLLRLEGWGNFMISIAQTLLVTTVLSGMMIQPTSSRVSLIPIRLHSLYDCQVGLTDQEDSSQIIARPLSWSRESIRTLLQETSSDFDVVLNCDCVYEPLLWRFLETLGGMYR